MITLKEIAETEEELINVIAEARTSFRSFAENIIQVNTKHEELDIQDFHVHWANQFLHNKRTCIVAPRSSGKCIAKGSRIPLASGEYKLIEEVQKHDRVLSLNDKGKIIASPVQERYSNGMKQVFEVTTRDGRSVKVTNNHPFLTPKGWKTIEEGLRKGERIAQAKVLPSHSEFMLPEEDIKLLAYLIAEGHLPYTGLVSFTNNNPKINKDFISAIRKKAWVIRRIKANGTKRANQYYIKKRLTQKNKKYAEVKLFLLKYGLLGSRSGNKFVPKDVMKTNVSQIKLFLNILWGCDGGIERYAKTPRPGYYTKSKQLALDVMTLLLRCGIPSILTYKDIAIKRRKTQRYYSVYVVTREGVSKFLNEIGAKGKEDKVEIAKKAINGSEPHYSLYNVPKELVLDFMTKKKWRCAYNDVTFEKVKRIAREDKNNDLMEISQSDVVWTQITSIASRGSLKGMEETYDLTIEKNHNFIANDFIVHNTYTMAVLVPLYIAFYEKNKSILITAHNLRRSKQIMKDIRWYINNNELLYSLKPDKRESSWSTQYVDTTTGCQVFLMPFTSDAVGEHVHYILLDEGGKLQDTSIFYNSITPMVNATRGNICVLGTPESARDLLAQLKDNTEYHYEKYQVVKEDGSPLWELRFSKEEMDKRRKEMTSLAFTRQFMTEVAEDSNQIFPSSLIVSCYDKEFKLDRVHTQTDNVYYGGVDLAMSKGGDYSVYTIIEKVGDKNIIRWITRYQGANHAKQLAEIINLNQTFKPRKWLVDKSVFGESFIFDMRRNGCIAEPYTFDPSNRIRLLNNLMLVMESQQLVIPRYDEGYTQTLTDKLSEELSHFVLGTTRTGVPTYKSVGKHDDTGMSLSLAVLAATSVGTAPMFFVAI